MDSSATSSYSNDTNEIKESHDVSHPFQNSDYPIYAIITLSDYVQREQSE